MNNGGRQQHPSGSGTDISRAATFCSASESSTSFISPQGTPITFNRIRHKLKCRSRHSSGVPKQTIHYSPMDVNNLNKPFSPQPSTHICQPNMAEPSYQSNINQFVSPFEDPMSRQPNGSLTMGSKLYKQNSASTMKFLPYWLTTWVSVGNTTITNLNQPHQEEVLTTEAPPIRELLLNHWGDQHRQPLSPLSPIRQVFT